MKFFDILIRHFHELSFLTCSIQVYGFLTLLEGIVVRASGNSRNMQGPKLEVGLGEQIPSPKKEKD